MGNQRISMSSKAGKIVLGVCGGIAAYKACDVLRQLKDKGCDVTVVMTEEATKFVSRLTFASLSGQRVYSSMFEDNQSAWEQSHIRIAQRADVLLVAPATANFIGKVASGIADDLLTCTTMAIKVPLLMAPAMNTNMFHNKIVQDNIAKLKKIGVKFIGPQKGRLACGAMGLGHISDVDVIVSETLRSLKRK